MFKKKKKKSSGANQLWRTIPPPRLSQQRHLGFYPLPCHTPPSPSTHKGIWALVPITHPLPPSPQRRNVGKKSLKNKLTENPHSLKQNEAHSTCVRSTNKGVNQPSKGVTQTQQQSLEPPRVTLIWHANNASKYKVHKPRKRMYIWWSSCPTYSLACQVRVTLGYSRICCCICLTSFEC